MKGEFFMNDREKVRRILESEEVPQHLRPENIDLILNSKKHSVKNSAKRYRNQYMQVIAGLVACMTISTCGIFLIGKKVPQTNIEDISETASEKLSVQPEITDNTSMLKSSESYDEIYKIFSYNSNSETVSACYDEDETEKYQKFNDSTVTDGKTIFSSNENTSFINYSRVENGEFLYSSSLDIGIFQDAVQSDIRSLFINSNTLFVVYESIMPDKNYITTVTAYDISYQNDEPLLDYISEYSQGGNFSDIKSNGDYIYLVTSETKTFSEDFRPENYGSYLPEYYIDNEKYYPEPEDIYVPSDFLEINSEQLNTGFTTVTSLKFSNNNLEQTDIKSFAKSAEFVCCTENNLYVTISNYSNAYTENTDILKFSLADGNITFQEYANTKGIPLNTDEYNGYFRIIVTYVQETNNYVYSKNAIYIFDENMNQAGFIDDLDSEQNIKFFEDIAVSDNYIVDLKNPEKLTITEKYQDIYSCMKNLSKNSYLNLEYLSEENGFKISVFDNSNNLISKFVQYFNDTEMFIDSPAFSDSNSLFVDYDKNIIGIPCYIQTEDYTTELRYEFYYFQNDSFQYIGNVSEFEKNCYSMNRALCIDDYIYVICGNQFISFMPSDNIIYNKVIFQI